jgi:Ca-activated chloride channel family protein
MNFHWPGAFLLLGLIPLLAFAYFLRQRRKRKYAVRFSSLTLVRSAVPSQSTVRRWLPLGLFFLAIAVLAILGTAWQPLGARRPCDGNYGT